MLDIASPNNPLALLWSSLPSTGELPRQALRKQQGQLEERGIYCCILDTGHQPWAKEMEEISFGLTPVNSCRFILKGWKTII